MQDVHWPSGAFGYFPSYTLGAMAAAQLAQSVRAALPALDAQVAAGDFQPLRDWLRTHIWSQGCLQDLDGLLQGATDAPLRLEPYLDHLRRRYTPDSAP